VWTVSVLLLLPLAILGLHITPAYKPTGELSAQSPSIQGMGAIQKHFTLGETGPLTVMLSAAADWDTPEGRELASQVSSALSHIENVAEVRSLTQPLGQPLPFAVEDAPSTGLLGNLMRVVNHKVGDALSQASQAAREHYTTTMAAPNGPRYV